MLIFFSVSGARNASAYNTMSTLVEFVITPIVGAFALTKLLMATTCKEMDKTPSCDENQKKMNNYEKVVLGKNTE